MTSAIPTLDEIRQAKAFHHERLKALEEMETSILAAASQWERYRQAIGDVIAPSSLIGGAGVPEMHQSRPRMRTQGARSKFERIAAVLEAPAPLWQTANQIKDNLLSQWNEDMKMSSISPALVAMRKDKHMLVRKNMTVALASRVKIEEPDTLFNENGEAVASPETGEPSRSPYDSPTLGWDDPA